MTSASPSFVTSATGAPVPSSSALVATVVPCPSTEGRTPVATSATPSRTARP